MPTINVTVRNKIAKSQPPAFIVCGNSDYTAVFDLDDEWAEFPNRVAVFVYQVGRERRNERVMNFKYHISILKSPLPFKAGVNISGNLDKMKIRVGKAKYKDDVTPAAIHKVDSTRMDLGRRIVERFHRIVGVR